MPISGDIFQSASPAVKLLTPAEIADARATREDAKIVREEAARKRLEAAKQAEEDAANAALLEEAFRANVDESGTPNRKGILAHLYKTKPQLAQGVEAQFVKFATDAAAAVKAERENELRDMEHDYQLLQGATDPQTFAFAKTQLRDPELAAQVGDAPTPEMLSFLNSALLKAQDYNAKMKQVDEKAKNDLDAVLGHASLAEDAEQWAEIWAEAAIKGVDDDLKAAGLGKEFSPAMAQKAAQLTMKPETRATLAGQAEGRQIQREGQAITAQGQRLTAQTAANRLAFDKQQAAEASGAAGDGGEGGLLQAVLDNPVIYRTLTPTAKQKLAPGLAARGFDFKRAESLTPSMQAGVKRLKSSLTMLQELDGDLTQLSGVGGKVAGKVQSGWAWLTGEDSSASLYGGIADSLLPALARSSGEVGNLAEQEQTRYARLAPKVSDPLNIRRAKYAAIQYIIDASESGASADEMRPFLDYMKFTTAGASAPAPARVGGPGPAAPKNPFRK